MTEKQIQNKLIRQYFGINQREARAKIEQLEETNELFEVLKLALEKDRMLSTIVCPKCGGEMKPKHGRNGPFLSCLAYPDCRGSRSLPSDVVDVTINQKEEAAKKLTIALNFIQEIGGADLARHWLSIAAQSLGEGSNVSPPTSTGSSNRFGWNTNQPKVDNPETRREETVPQLGSNPE